MIVVIMPLYEYACQTCDTEFEVLVRASEAPECPACHGTALERQFSVFAPRAGGAASRPAAMNAPGGCGRCGDPRGPGACSIN
jgi:putative FmdB family regulatory protein